MTVNGDTPIVSLHHTNELYHHGVKGMKWGVRKAVRKISTSAHRTGQAINAAHIENQVNRVRRAMARNKVRNKNNKVARQQKNARYKARLKRLNSTYNSRVSDLSEIDIERGRDVYKTIKNVSISVAVAAATTTVGSVYAPAAVAAKLAGAGLTTVLTNADSQDDL